METIPKWVKTLGIVCGVGCLGIIIWGYASKSSSTNIQSQPRIAPAKWATWDGESEIPNAEVIVVTEGYHGSEYLSGTGNMHGMLKNSSGQSLKYAAVTYGIYNQNDTKTGSCLANENYLANGASWEFDALCTGVPAGEFKYKVEDVTYW